MLKETKGFLKGHDVTLKEEQLLDNRILRDKNINKYEVLERVKKLLLIPETEVATMQQVADFYEVGLEAIKTVVHRNREELFEDGLQSLSGKEAKEFLVSCNLQPTNEKGYFVAEGIKFAHKNNTLFPRRAILRVGMLLRDSNVAQEVRTQLLNIEEKTDEDTKQTDIIEEQALAIELGMSYASGDETAVMAAHAKLMAFKNRHISKLQVENQRLETTNKALTNGILEWEDRSRLNFAIRKLAYLTHTQYAIMWNELYRQLLNKYHMNLKARSNGKSPYIQYVKEHEWDNVIKCMAALCRFYGYEAEEIFVDLEVE